MKIVLGSTQWPYNGGGGTVTYNMTKYLRSKGWQVACIYFESNDAVDYDPDKVGGVWNMNRMRNANDDDNSKRESKINAITHYLDGYPQLTIGTNILAPIYCKWLFPKCPCLYSVIGSHTFTEIAKSRSQSFVTFTEKLKEPVKFDKINVPWTVQWERTCCNIVDAIFCNSPGCRYSFLIEHPEYAKKVSMTWVDISEGTHELAGNVIVRNKIRSYDLLFVSSSVSRPVKNANFFYELCKDSRLKKCKKAIIGSDAVKIKNDRTLAVLGNVKYDIVQRTMKISKFLLVTSMYDAAPNVVREAIKCGCIPIVSKNVGYYSLLPNWCVCNDVNDKEEWINKIQTCIKDYDKLEVPSFEAVPLITSLSLVYQQSLCPYKNHKILIVTTQRPDNGGAATNAYDVCILLRNYLHIDCAILFLNPGGPIDPQEIGGTFECKTALSYKNFDQHAHYDKKNDKVKFDICNYLKGEPMIILAKNHFAPIEMKKMFPNVPIVYLMCGCIHWQAGRIPLTKNISVTQYLKDPFAVSPENIEIKCIDKSTITVANSNTLHQLANILYPEYMHKFVDYVDTSLATWYVKKNMSIHMHNNDKNDKNDKNNKNKKNNKIDWDKRKYDIAFCTSNVNRKEKNVDFVKKLLPIIKQKKWQVVVIGAGAKLMFSNVKFITKYELLPRNEVLNILKNTRTCLICSLIDSSPNLFIEAIECGCNILTTKNIGLYNLLPKEMICDDYAYENLEEWTASVETCIQKHVNINLEKYAIEHVTRLLKLLNTI